MTDKGVKTDVLHIFFSSSFYPFMTAITAAVSNILGGNVVMVCGGRTAFVAIS